MKPRVIIVGAGLCGSLLAALLRDRYAVTVIEQGQTARPLYGDIACDTGEVNNSINRAEGLGGTTNYWHNALIEMSDSDLRNAGFTRGADALAGDYARAWSFFLSDEERRTCEDLRAAHDAFLGTRQAELAHMVLPHRRTNMWQAASARFGGAEIEVVHGRAVRLHPGSPIAAVEVESAGQRRRVEAERIVVCAGGLATPALLARSLDSGPALCDGYHDHPMAYVAKVRLAPGSRLKDVSCAVTGFADVRAGFVYESGGIKTVVYLRPALNLGLRSIIGPARFILSDLRNDPFSPRKMLRLLGNPEAVREAVLFKTGGGFRGDYFSVLLFGEQSPLTTRGVSVDGAGRPALNWHVTDAERHAYEQALTAFLDDAGADVVERRLLPARDWEFRTAAHHSGASRRFMSSSGEPDLAFFEVPGAAGVCVCDASLLRAGGIANSGLTLAALTFRLADWLAAS